MKKLIIIFFIFGAFSTLNAQFFNYGIKGGINYNSNGNLRSVSGFTEDLKIHSDNQTGYHFGVITEFKFPFWLYIRPELLYTHTTSGYQGDTAESELSINKLDMPVLVGIRFLKIGRIFAGPVFTYMFDTEFDDSSVFDNVKNISNDDLSVGGQLGVGVEIWRFGVDMRWEVGFTDNEAQFIGDLTDDYIGSSDDATISIETRPQQFIVSVYYKFK